VSEARARNEKLQKAPRDSCCVMSYYLAVTGACHGADTATWRSHN
jgi:hypothetical protein